MDQNQSRFEEYHQETDELEQDQDADSDELEAFLSSTEDQDLASLPDELFRLATGMEDISRVLFSGPPSHYSSLSRPSAENTAETSSSWSSVDTFSPTANTTQMVDHVSESKAETASHFLAERETHRSSLQHGVVLDHLALTQLDIRSSPDARRSAEYLLSICSQLNPNLSERVSSGSDPLNLDQADTNGMAFYDEEAEATVADPSSTLEALLPFPRPIAPLPVRKQHISAPLSSPPDMPLPPLPSPTIVSPPGQISVTDAGPTWPIEAYTRPLTSDVVLQRLRNAAERHEWIKVCRFDSVLCALRRGVL